MAADRVFEGDWCILLRRPNGHLRWLRARPDQTRPDQTRPDQTRPDQIGDPPQGVAPHAHRGVVGAHEDGGKHPMSVLNMEHFGPKPIEL